jgi:D-3-phosphoglycerate dehydrogenase
VTFTVLITDHAWPSLDIERRILSEVGADLIVAERGDESEIIALAPAADAILTNWKKVPAAALDAAPHCVVVSRYGVGVDNIPVDHATALGIIVTNVPDFCLDEVSDHAMALLLACARRVVRFASSTAAGAWQLDLARGIARVRGQTLGLIGYGSIARALVPKARGFGLEVVAYTPRSQRGFDDGGVERTNDLAYLLARADYVSLHAPSTHETRGLIGEAQLRAMKPSAFLINTSRGALVDEGALLQALERRWIAGAALDVLAVEPARSDHPFRALENVILTPHAAFYSEQAIEELEHKAAANVATVLGGGIPAEVVNRAVLERPDLRRPGPSTT